MACSYGRTDRTEESRYPKSRTRTLCNVRLVQSRVGCYRPRWRTLRRQCWSGCSRGTAAHSERFSIDASAAMPMARISLRRCTCAYCGPRSWRPSAVRRHTCTRSRATWPRNTPSRGRGYPQYRGSSRSGRARRAPEFPRPARPGPTRAAAAPGAGATAREVPRGGRRHGANWIDVYRRGNLHCYAPSRIAAREGEHFRAGMCGPSGNLGHSECRHVRARAAAANTLRKSQ